MRGKAISDYRRHAKRRSFERYGVALNDNDLKEIVKMLRKKSNRNNFNRKRYNEKKIKATVPYKGTEFNIIYHRKKKIIITFLPN